MEGFLQSMPYDALGKRAIRLDPDKVVVAFKSMARSYTDEYPYGNLNPDFKRVRRGEPGWNGVAYGCIVFSIVLFLIVKMSHSLIFKSVLLAIQLGAVATAVYLLTLIFFKKEYVYVLDNSGESILEIKASAKSKKFLDSLRQKIIQAKPRP